MSEKSKNQSFRLRLLPDSFLNCFYIGSYRVKALIYRCYGKTKSLYRNNLFCSNKYLKKNSNFPQNSFPILSVFLGILEIRNCLLIKKICFKTQFSTHEIFCSHCGLWLARTWNISKVLPIKESNEIKYLIPLR